MSKWPSKKELNRVLDKMKSVDGTVHLAPDASSLEKFRWEICQKFIRYKREHGITQRQLAELIQTDEGKVSKILHHRIDEFSTDRLIGFYQLINPDVKIKVS